MAYKRKYRKGKQITSLDELYKQEFIYQGSQILHHGWFGSWQLRLSQIYIDRGWLYTAEKVDGENAD